MSMILLNCLLRDPEVRIRPQTRAWHQNPEKVKKASQYRRESFRWFLPDRIHHVDRIEAALYEEIPVKGVVNWALATEEWIENGSNPDDDPQKLHPLKKITLLIIFLNCYFLNTTNYLEIFLDKNNIIINNGVQIFKFWLHLKENLLVGVHFMVFFSFFIQSKEIKKLFFHFPYIFF
ncbi:hypothetical protein RFI_23184 [Reticulomyxa filosa]|uniref:Uncharacterized protein n=1 Tax=Reticulomyxa filosa TaxID=46433 RepID=X6MJJ2_RETFI|nr:hypothetical protein RFI_23184 [Reticulomyxa filosa]|eukprot:ETO14183.1 hypothetical protein RFI_23184 [Reticulomyxa filosa]